MADVTVLENPSSAFSSTSRGDIHHRSGQVVGTNHLVGEQHPGCGIDCTQQAIAKIGFSARLHRAGIGQPAFDSVREAELVPGPKATAEEIRELARLGSGSFGHPVGTYRMGMDTLAVVDPTLRVHGLLGLRVADASMMPRIITGPTNAPTHMIAGRASNLVLGRDA